MRLIATRIALFTVLAAFSAYDITAHAATKPAEGAALITVAPPTSAAANQKKKDADAKATWKAAKAMDQSAPAAAEPFSLRVRNGSLSVDGTLAKERMEYTVENATALYFYLPGIGNVVVSPEANPGAVEVKAAFQDNVLAFTVDGHSFNLKSEGQLTNRTSKDVFVRLDTSASAMHQGSYMLMGYAVMMQGPYTASGQAVAEAATVASTK